ncbi:MAG: hypothetical protein AAF701_09675, partial [Pseudomonadota bacterium]
QDIKELFTPPADAVDPAPAPAPADNTEPPHVDTPESVAAPASQTTVEESPATDPQVPETPATQTAAEIAPEDPTPEMIILPVLRSEAQVAAAREKLGRDVLTVPVAAGLVQAFIEQGDDSFTLLGPDTFEGQALKDVQKKALGAMRVILHKTDRELVAKGALRDLKFDGVFESSLAFLPRVWQLFSQEIGGAPIVLFAASNRVLVAAENNATAIQEIKAVVPRVDQLPNKLSGQLYRWERGNWTAWSDPA